MVAFPAATSCSMAWWKKARASSILPFVPGQLTEIGEEHPSLRVVHVWSLLEGRR